MFGNRKLASYVSFFALGVVFTALLALSDVWIFCIIPSVVCIAALIVFFALSKRDSKQIRIKKAAAAAVAFFVLGMLRTGLFDLKLDSLSEFSGRNDTVTVTVTDVGTFSDIGTVTGKVTASDADVPSGTKIRFFLENKDYEIKVGDSAELYACYQTHTSSYLLSDAVMLSAGGRVLSVDEGTGAVYSFRRFITKQCDMLLSPLNVPVAKAVTVGDTEMLSGYDYSMYNSAGISHLLAISGLHITLITMGLYGFLGSVFVGRKTRSIICSTVALFYSAAVGFSPSSVRAAIMICIMLLARLFVRRADGITSMFFALFVLLSVNPYAIFSLGLQLSFLCCLGLRLVAPAINTYLQSVLDRFKSKGFFVKRCLDILLTVATSLVSSATVVAFSFPALFLSVSSMSNLSPLINIFAIPLFSLALSLTLFAVLISVIWLPLAGIVAVPADWIFTLLRKLCEHIHGMGVGSISLLSKPAFLPLLFSVLLVGALLFFRRRRGVIAVCILLSFSLSVGVCGLYDRLYNQRNTVIEVAGNVYFSQRGSNCYVDFGGYSASINAVYRHGMTSLDYYMLAGYDGYTLNRIDAVTSELAVKTVLLPAPTDEESLDTFIAVKQLATSRKCAIIIYNDLFSLDVSDTDLFFSPCGDGNMLTVISDDFSILVLGRDCDADVRCDIAVLTDSYNGIPDNIICDTICISSDSSPGFYLTDADTRVYGDGICIRFKDTKGEPLIYEP